MGEYADVKIKKVKRLLKWLETKEDIIVVYSGKHNYSVKHTFAKRPFPVPINHGVMNKYIVKDLMKHLIEWRVCTKQEFDQRIK